jgi:uncharacterized protein (TIGR03437 family)
MALASVVSMPAQSFDSSGNGQLKGSYFVRQVLLSDFNSNTGSIGRAQSLLGTMVFDGAGNYSFSGTLTDTNAGSTPTAYSVTGGYSVESSGLAQIYNPILNDGQTFLFGAVAQSVALASSTENQYGDTDVFIAIPEGASVTNSSLKGNFVMGSLDFVSGSETMAHDAYFTLTADGAGNFSSISINGTGANFSNNATVVTQTVAGATYSLTSTGVGTANFPVPSSSTAAQQLISGSKTLYISSNGNFILGGSPNGYDIIVGIPALTASATNATFSGLYYQAALEEDEEDVADFGYDSDSFYGSVNVTGNGESFNHLRLNDIFVGVYDFTYDMPYSTVASGLIDENPFEYFLGLGGKAFIEVGIDGEYSLTLGIQPTITQGSGVFLNPVGIVNAASLVPITNSVAPNEFVSLFGSDLASSALGAPSLPLPTTLNNVQVSVNGTLAPLSFVSPGQINLILPNEIDPSNVFYATFQVTNNNSPSNSVTVYTNFSAPGVFSLQGTGYGPGAIEHANGTVVTSASPAQVGETVVAFVNGLGATSPAAIDGQAASSSTLSTVNDDVAVFVDGVEANVTFAGLTPGFAGLYQINAQIPSGVSNGSVYFDVSTDEAYASLAQINVTGGTAAAAPESAEARAKRLSRMRPRLRRHSFKQRTINIAKP